MIQKIYEVYCDNCGDCIKHYMGKKPTMEELEMDGFVCTPTKVFCCGQCKEEYERERKKLIKINKL